MQDGWYSVDRKKTTFEVVYKGERVGVFSSEREAYLAFMGAFKSEAHA